MSDNLATSVRYIEEAACSGSSLVILPELFLYRGNPKEYRVIAEPLDGPIVRLFQSLARKRSIAIVLGSIVEKGDDGLYDTAVFINDDGIVVGRYRKIHLFKVTLPNTVLDERKLFRSGKELLVGPCAGLLVGAAICFDIRFPAMFAGMREAGADVFIVPSNFTHETGKDHWEVLLRARAIETQSYLIAVNCCGIDEYSGVKSYGHSMVIDPWGAVCCDLNDTEGCQSHVLDLNMVSKVRGRMPLEAL